MTGHKERLIAAGLYKPMTEYERSERDDKLRIAKYDKKIKGIPNWCVYRTDDWRNHIEGKCKDAELIADRLYLGEAHMLVAVLGHGDPEQPPRPYPDDPPLCMYHITTMEEWERWVTRREQISMF